MLWRVAYRFQPGIPVEVPVQGYLALDVQLEYDQAWALTAIVHHVFVNEDGDAREAFRQSSEELHLLMAILEFRVRGRLPHAVSSAAPQKGDGRQSGSPSGLLVASPSRVEPDIPRSRIPRIRLPSEALVCGRNPKLASWLVRAVQLGSEADTVKREAGYADLLREIDRAAGASWHEGGRVREAAAEVNQVPRYDASLRRHERLAWRQIEAMLE